MPTYEYACDTCGGRFDVFQSMNDAPVEKCSSCGAPVRRLIGGGVGIIFKGSGFYVNDYKGSGSSKKSAKSDSCSSCSSEGSCAAKE